MASFDYAVAYSVTAACVSPLRTGGTDGDVEMVLLGSDGLPMVQGSSIAGVLRSWVSRHGRKGDAERLFGASRSGTAGDRTSLVTVSDGVFDADAVSQLRPRLRMDGAAGTGMDSQKFAMRSMETGSVFRFQLLLQTKGRDTAAERLLEEALSALHSQQIGIGGQSANGFGLVKLSVKCRRFDLTQAADRMAWLEDAEPTEPVKLSRLAPESITFTVTGSTSGVLVRSGQREKRGDKNSVATAILDGKKAVLPGSSLKGLIRGRAEMIAHYLNCPEECAKKLFGTQGSAGQLRIRECRIELEKRRVITRTRISRFTGGVMEQKLFSEEPVSGTVCIEAVVKPRNKEKAIDERCLGLLFYALRDLAMGLYSIGSEGSIGRGCLRNGALTVTDKGRSCTLRFGDGDMVREGDTGFVEQWLKSLEGGETT